MSNLDRLVGTATCPNRLGRTNGQIIHRASISSRQMPQLARNLAIKAVGVTLMRSDRYLICGALNFPGRSDDWGLEIWDS